MTGYTVHTGSTEKFSNSWDRIFSGGAKPAKAASAAQQTPAKKAAVKKGKKQRRA